MPGAAYAVALVVEIGAGLAFLVGWKGRSAAALCLILAIWCVATAYVAHSHFSDDTGQMIHFMKNMCTGGRVLAGLRVWDPGAGSASIRT